MKASMHQKTLGDLIGEWDMGFEDYEKDGDRFLTIQEACRYLGLHPNTVYRHIAQDHNLKVYNLHTGCKGKPCYRILKSDLDDWLAGRQM